jgi:hypothetical protein
MLIIFLVFCVVFFGGVCVDHLFSFLCCVFDEVRVDHLFSFLSCVFGGVRVDHLFSFLSCVFGGVYVDHSSKLKDLDYSKSADWESIKQNAIKNCFLGEAYVEH